MANKHTVRCCKYHRLNATETQFFVRSNSLKAKKNNISEKKNGIRQARIPHKDAVYFNEEMKISRGTLIYIVMTMRHVGIVKR